MRDRLYDLLPYLWYLAGSLCFVIGTLVVIWRRLSH